MVCGLRLPLLSLALIGAFFALSFPALAAADTTPPAASWGAPSSPTGDSTLYFNLSFDEQVTAPLGSSISNTGSASGCSFLVSLISPSFYTVAVSGCSEGTVQLNLDADSVEDGSGNLGPAASLLSSQVVIDRTAPDLQWSEPASPSADDPLLFGIALSEAVTGLDGSDFTNSGSASGCSFFVSGVDDTNYSLSVSSCSGGTVAPSISAGAFADLAGNPGAASNANPVVLDRSGPTITWTSPSAYTNQTSMQFGLQLSEPPVGLLSGDFTNSGSASGCSFALTGSGLDYTLDITSCSEGTVIATLATGAFSDALGNLSPAASSPAITVDQSSPGGSWSEPASPSASATLVYTLNTDEPVQAGQVSTDDFSLIGDGCSIQSITTTPPPYTSSITVTVDGCSSGQVSLALLSGRLLDRAGNTGPAVELAADPVTVQLPNPPPVNQSPPVVSGVAAVGEVLQATSGVWSPAGESYGYQWKRCDTSGLSCAPISGAMSQNYTAQPADTGKKLLVEVTAYQNSGSDSVIEPSDPTDVISGPPVNYLPPSISGAAQSGSELTATPGSWYYVSPSSFDLIWQSSIDGVSGWVNIGSGTTITLTGAEVDKFIRVVEQVDSGASGSGSQESNMLGAVQAAPSAPEVITPPAISPSSPKVGVEAQAVGATYAPPLAITLYQWVSCPVSASSYNDAGCTNISGANSSSYTPSGDDLGRKLAVTLTVSYSGQSDSKGSLLSAAVSHPAPPVNTSLPTVNTASPFEGEVIYATPGSWSGDEEIVYQYQWFTCTTNISIDDCSEIPSAATQGLTVLAAHKGLHLRVRVMASNGAASDVVAFSDPTAPVSDPPSLPVNITPPALSGVSKQGKTLFTTDGEWDDPSYDIYYLWQRCDAEATEASCTSITSPVLANTNSYTLTADDVGSTLRAKVFASNGATSVVAFTGYSSVVLPPAPPVNLERPIVPASALVGSPLSAIPASWSGVTPFDISYQWVSCPEAVSDPEDVTCSSVSGANLLSYTPLVSDAGKRLWFKESISNEDGSSVAFSPSGTLVSRVPSIVSAPTVTGSVAIGEQLSLSNGTWEATPDVSSYNYKWFTCSSSSDEGTCVEIDNQTEPTLTVVSQYVGSFIRGKVFAVNSVSPPGGVGSLSAATSKVLPDPPASISLPSLSGENISGQVLSSTSGVWSSTVDEYHYQWQVCDSDSAAYDDPACDLVGSDSSSYTLVNSDAARFARVRVTAVNEGGSSSALSSFSEAIRRIPHNTSPPVISGTPVRQGQTLSVSDGSWQAYPSPSFSYQWESCSQANDTECDPVGTNSSSFTLTASEVGRYIRAVVTADNDTTNIVEHTAFTSQVLPLPPASLAPPMISGTAKVGVSLTASDGSWSNNPTAFSYQWESCSQADDTDCNPVGGDLNVYTPASGDLGKFIRVVVSASNAGGSGSESSSFTSAVLQIDPPANLTPPSISGTARQGQTLTGGQGSWAGADLDITGLWQRCNSSGDSCVGIPGTDDTTSYQLQQADVGSRIVYLVTAENAGGVLSVPSAPTDAVAPLDNLAAPSIISAPAPLSRSVAILFSGTEGASFECSINEGAYAACTSPFSPSLSDGAYQVRIRQSRAGQTSEPATVSFRLDRTPPRPPTIVGAPQEKTPRLSAALAFTGEEGAAFYCRLDQAEWVACVSPAALSVEEGKHTFSVYQVDAAGNTGDSTTASWEVTSGSRGNGSGDLKAKVQVDDQVEVSGSTATVGCQAEGAEIEGCEVSVYRYMSKSTKNRIRVAKKGLTKVKLGQGSAKAEGDEGVLPVTLRLNSAGRRLISSARGPLKMRISITLDLKDALDLSASTKAAFLPSRQSMIPFGGMFHSGLSSPTPGGRRYISTVLRRLPNSVRKVTCVGHTDSVGPADLNYKLGRERAEAVCGLLRKGGLRADYNISSRGESAPRASNRTSRGRALNRRVEIRVTYR